ncbi:MAG: low molecular weight protein-tyrosine-phosphatase [Pleomorphochaeta sp.]
MIKIMFICHGNICRSPMAQSYFFHLVQEKGLSDKFLIESSATSREELSNPPHYGTREVLSRHNIKLIKHYSKLITKAEADEFDYLICMDQNNISNLKRLIDKRNYDKIYLLLEFAKINRSISDPWYTGNFNQTYDDVKLGCEALLDYLIENNGL